MKKLTILLGSVSASFAHLHTEASSSIMGDAMHILSEPDHILIVATMAVALVVGYKKFSKAK
jgi:hypothetical protein